jgi:glucose/arabinose dehydrogenase
MSDKRYGWIFAVWILLVAALASGQTLKDPTLAVVEITAELTQPTAMAFIGPNDILVLQKRDGTVRRVIDGIVQAGVVLDVAVDQASERGLLGIALHPTFPATPWIYLYYTESSTGSDTSGTPAPAGNRIYRFTWNGQTLVEPALILDLPALPGPNHDGGVLTFGPDGKLYAVIGDLNRDGQLQNVPNGPPPDDTSVIFRLNDDGTVPNDNPFFAQGGNLSKYYAYGIRNSFGLAFDPSTNKLWMTENGPSTYDEINLVEPGFNSGWVPIRGPLARSPQGTDSLFQVPGSSYADPKFSWFDTVAPTALLFLNSPRLGAAYVNDLLVGDINTGTLYRFRLTPSRDSLVLENPGLADSVADPSDDAEEIVFGSGFGGITDLKIGPDGRLYVLSYQGKIFAVSQEFASVQGVVRDITTGTALAGVVVRCRQIEPASDVCTPTSTDAAGTYAFNDLHPGRYRLSYSLGGYRTRWRHLQLSPGEDATLDVTLTPR